MAAWAALSVVGFGLWRGLQALPHEAPLVIDTTHPSWTSDLALPAASLVVGAFAVLRTLVGELPLDEFGQVTPPEIPFTDAGAAAAFILVVAVLAIGALIKGPLARRASILIAGGVVAYAIPFEVYDWAVSVLWVALGLLAIVAHPAGSGRAARIPGGAAVMVGLAAAVAIWLVAPPSRLVVGIEPVTPLALLQALAALAAVVAGLVTLARSGGAESWVRWVWLAAGVMTVYTLSIAVVGLVATQVGTGVEIDERQTQGQVALSVLWAVLGLAAFVAGLRWRIADLRHGGLALLALATAKVFLFDLASLDVAYRVISLIALGLLLLTSAWVWQRLQHGAEPRDGHAGI